MFYIVYFLNYNKPTCPNGQKGFVTQMPNPLSLFEEVPIQSSESYMLIITDEQKALQ